MTGFFSKKELEENTKIRYSEGDTTNCNKCGLYRISNSPRMKYTGKGNKNCFSFAEASGPDEDRLKVQLIGKTGQWYRDKLLLIGLDLDRDFWKANSVNCFPNINGQFRKPQNNEVKLCRSYLESMIDECKPSHIWVMGEMAVYSFFGDDFDNTDIARWRGLCIPDKKYNAWVSFFYHPSHPMREEQDENLQALYMRDLELGKRNLSKTPFTHNDYEKDVILLKNIDEITAMLLRLSERTETIAFIDYETTGLKPYRDGHRIVAISITFDNQTYSFPYQYRDYFDSNQQFRIKRLFKRVLDSDNIKKVAHNIKYENTWSKAMFDSNNINWIWDTMMGARIQDNRRGYSGLKFQVYLNYGIRPYDKYISEFLDDKGKEFNNVDKIPLNDLLLYNGLDTLFCSKLYSDQVNYFKTNSSMKEAYDLFHEGTIEFSNMESVGICVDEEYYHEKDKEITIKLKEIKDQLNEKDEVKQFFKKHGKPVDWGSNKDLGDLFYSIIGASIEFTKKGNPSVDKNALLKIKHPIVEQLLEWRNLEKTQGTYLAQFAREVCNGKIHPLFDLGVSNEDKASPLTYRSAGSRPNFQNIPIRDEQAKKYCRMGIFPSPGNQILEPDFSGIEVAIAACYNHDPQMITYITDKSTDMHRDCSCDLWILPPSEITKDIRFYTKNGWTFPEFYGSWYGECAKNLWENCKNLKIASGKPLMEHCAEVGLFPYEEFEEHCRSVEKIFWEKRFRVYSQWKDEVNELYRKRGYIETHFGFRFKGYMPYRKVTNYPIQATAFHCLLWTLINISKIAKEEKWKSKICGQIHDSMFLDCVPEEMEHVMKTVNKVGTEDIRKFDWICVPLKIDFEGTEINQPWYTKKEIKI